MLTSIRSLTAASVLSLSLWSMPALAQQEAAAQDAADAEADSASAEAFTLSGNVALTTDYRFRGVSFSGGDVALQGGIDLAHESGLYVGTWGSTIDADAGFGEMELDVYGGWSGDVADGLSVDLGLLYYMYPTEDTGADTDYFEALGSVSTQLGPVGATAGIGYSWDQAALADDNLYLYTDFELGVPNTPVTVTAHLGYTDGAFATQLDGTSFDWGVGASYAVTDNLSLGVNYVDTQGPAIEDFTDSGLYFTLGYSM